MATDSEWSTGKVLYIYFCGAILGANVTWLAAAASAGDTVLAPVLGGAVGLLLPVLPYAAVRRGRDSMVR